MTYGNHRCNTLWRCYGTDSLTRKLIKARELKKPIIQSKDAFLGILYLKGCFQVFSPKLKGRKNYKRGVPLFSDIIVELKKLLLAYGDNVPEYVIILKIIVTFRAIKIKRLVFKGETHVMPEIFNRDRYNCHLDRTNANTPPTLKLRVKSF